MAYSAKTIVKLAEQEVGYLEKESNRQLDSNTANAGDENYTKYARDLYAAGYYNGNKNGYHWCDVFVDWLFYKAFGEVVGQQLQCQTGKLGASCKYSAKYYKDAGRFYADPKVGDQIFFKNTSGTPCHTGVVIGVTSSKVITIEGNTSTASGVVANGGGVAKKTYSINYSKIYGYGRPKYDDEPTETRGVCNVELSVLKKGAKGDSVKALQTMLIGYGYSCGSAGADGSFGGGTDAAVRAYQKANKLVVDGSVGAATWAKLLGVK